MSRQYEAIDLLELYSKGDHSKWNKFLLQCEKKQDLLTLEKTLYGVQAGMADLAKQKLNSEKICIWFARLIRSLEISMQNIVRRKTPNPLDNPLNKTQWIHFQDEKRKRDHDLRKHIRKISY